jgi:ADP-heptose:LPS heptosyltransferase
MKKILIIQTAFLGDVILATPILEALHNQFPSSEFHFLVRKGNESLLKNHPKIFKLWIWEKQNGKWKSMFSLIKNFRKEKFDLIINAQRFFSSGVITLFSGGEKTIGFKKNPLSFLFSKAVPHFISNINPEGIHEVDRNLTLIDSYVENVSTFRMPKLYPFETLSFSPDSKYVCIAPSSVWFTKQWPLENWGKLIQNFPEDITIYLLGAPNDYNLCEKLANYSAGKNTVNLAGKISLLQSASLMKDSLMNYVNDSAPMHLCSAMNAPVTAIFCSTVPEFGFGPLSNISFVWQNLEKLDCRPCNLHGYSSCPKGHFNCSKIPIPRKPLA